LKALAKERLHDWREKLGVGLGLNVVELSGDVTPNLALLKRYYSHIVVDITNHVRIRVSFT
jgi:hypothetical protein